MKWHRNTLKVRYCI